MKIRSLLAIGFILTSCTIEPEGADVKKELHLPLTYSSWEIRDLASSGAQAACAVTSGHNGLTFVVRNSAQGKVVSVQTERFMPKGTWMTVTVNGNRYETSNPYFSAQDALAMVEDFSVAEKAYAEWSEIGSTSGRIRNGTVLKLNGFKRAFEKCQQ